MANTLNFNNVKKHYLTVTLADEKNTTLLIGMPTKAMIEAITALQDTLDSVSETEANIDSLNEVYDACAKVMSRNKAGVKISADFLAEIFDFEDVTIFLNAYLDFVNTFANEKN